MIFIPASAQAGTISSHDVMAIDRGFRPADSSWFLRHRWFALQQQKLSIWKVERHVEMWTCIYNYSKARVISYLIV